MTLDNRAWSREGPPKILAPKWLTIYNDFYKTVCHCSDANKKIVVWLEEQIGKADREYRLGNTYMDDDSYDRFEWHLWYLDPENKLLDKIITYK